MNALALPLRVFEYWLLQYRRVWRGSVVSSIVNPVFYLGALGIGLGTLVNKSSGQPLGVPYLDFVAPGMLAATAMTIGSIEASWPVMGSFRWTRQYASLYVDANARVIDIGLRSPMAATTKQPTLVQITSGGQTLANVHVGDAWTYVTLTLPPPEPPLQFSRINLRSNRTARVSDLVPGSEDPREVAVQVGDIKIVNVSWDFVPKPAGARESP